MDTRTLDDGSFLHATARGAMQFHDLGNGVAIHTCIGVSDGEFAPLVLADGERILKRYGRVLFFVDAYDNKIATSDFREALTKWMADKPTVANHMLIRSKLIEMAVSVAQMVSRGGQFKAYSDIATWERAGRREVPSFARRPLVLPPDITLR